MFDLISIGDSVIDTFVPLLEAEVESIDHGSEIKLCLPFGRKIPVGQSVSMVAGNAANNAVGSSRLGLKTAIYTNVGNLGDEKFDDRIIRKLKKEGVNTRYVIENEDLPSNHNIILDFKGERTILTHHQAWKFELPDLDQSKWVYLTSLSPSFVKSNLISQLVNYLERTGAKLVFNPGTFQIKVGVKKYPRLLSLVEVFIVNKEEAKLVLGHEKENVPIKKLLDKITALGPRQVVITDGVEGAYGFDGENYYHLEVFSAKLVQKTGAGDAFSSGTLAGLFYGEDLASAMRWGAANSASVVEHIGAQTGLLTLNQIRSRLKENSKIIAKEI